MIGIGVDAGSRAIKVVLWDAERGAVLASGVADQGPGPEPRAEALLNKLLVRTGASRPPAERIVATGYARKAIRFAGRAVTEITCHARGVRCVAPSARTVIEIGGQDSKVIAMDKQGTVRDFSMNDRCAAGTGRFLEVAARLLDVSLDDFGKIAGKSSSPCSISSMCVVFAETEIVGLLAEGAAREDVAAGIQRAHAARVAALVSRSVEEPIYFTGGVALIPGMAQALSAALCLPILVAPDPQLTGALGAARIAAD